MSTTTCQVVAFLLSILGLAGCIAATGMDMWSTQDLYDNPVTSVFQYEGLWRSCVRQSSGFTECRPYFTILGLPGRHRASRGRARWTRWAGKGAFALSPTPTSRWGPWQLWLRMKGVNKRRSWLVSNRATVIQEKMGGLTLKAKESLVRRQASRRMGLL